MDNLSDRIKYLLARSENKTEQKEQKGSPVVRGYNPSVGKYDLQLPNGAIVDAALQTSGAVGNNELIMASAGYAVDKDRVRPNRSRRRRRFVKNGQIKLFWYKQIGNIFEFWLGGDREPQKIFEWDNSGLGKFTPRVNVNTIFEKRNAGLAATGTNLDDWVAHINIVYPTKNDIIQITNDRITVTTVNGPGNFSDYSWLGAGYSVVRYGFGYYIVKNGVITTSVCDQQDRLIQTFFITDYTDTFIEFYRRRVAYSYTDTGGLPSLNVYQCSMPTSIEFISSSISRENEIYIDDVPIPSNLYSWVDVISSTFSGTDQVDFTLNPFNLTGFTQFSGTINTLEKLPSTYSPYPNVYDVTRNSTGSYNAISLSQMGTNKPFVIRNFGNSSCTSFAEFRIVTANYPFSNTQTNSGVNDGSFGILDEQIYPFLDSGAGSYDPLIRFPNAVYHNLVGNTAYEVIIPQNNVLTITDGDLEVYVNPNIRNESIINASVIGIEEISKNQLLAAQYYPDEQDQ